VRQHRQLCLKRIRQHCKTLHLRNKKKDMAKIYNITRITKDKIQYFEILMSSDDSFRPSGRAAAWNVSEA
jgi:hypothetical protein